MMMMIIFKPSKNEGWKKIIEKVKKEWRG